MFFDFNSLQEINHQLDDILLKVLAYEKKYESLLNNIHPKYKESARNLIHYLAMRTFDNVQIQERLAQLGLPSSSNFESHILYSILSMKVIVHKLLDIDDFVFTNNFLSQSEAKQLLCRHSDDLYGDPPVNRRTRILVTQPTIASEDLEFAKNLISNGMDCARVNCAHDNEAIWEKIIDNIRSVKENCKILMDLGGPKLRTGKMEPGPKVIHIKPKRNSLGQVVSPAKVWLAPYGILPEEQDAADAIIPVNKKWLKKTKKGSYITFKDARDKKCKILIEEKEGIGRWGSCSDSAFVSIDTLLNVFIKKKGDSEVHNVVELLPLEEVIYLFEGDLLRIDKAPILGEPAKLDEHGKVTDIAHISCTLPEVFEHLKVAESVFFDDGKIEGVIKEISADHLLVKITKTKKNGGKLKAEKGINFPESDIKINGLTEKDKCDLKFISKHADSVNFSFVNTKNDVEDLLSEMRSLNSKLGIILKIETKEAFKNLPSILLKAMENYPVGVMIARGDLAIETGWKNIAVIQEELLRICEAAHIPNIWATQVLENLAKKGVPTRSEITDAAMAQRSECVMLNKGDYINRALKMLDKILSEMQHINQKKKNMLPQLKFNPLI